jgi:2-oxoglutarate ferredoxin oxidoreductase subunit beta
MVSHTDYDIDRATAWCPGCGNIAILNALKRALPEAGLAPHEVALITGIGQAPKTFDYMHICGFNGLHGRPLPVATGFRLANHGMKVIVGHGDGDAYGEGGNHFLHSAAAISACWTSCTTTRSLPSPRASSRPPRSSAG